MNSSSNSAENNFGSTSITDPLILKIRTGLMQTTSLDILRDAIFDAQQLVMDDELPDEMIGILNSSKLRFVSEKKLHEEISSKMVATDISQKRAGLAALEDLERQGKTDFYFGPADTIRPLGSILGKVRSELAIPDDTDSTPEPMDATTENASDRSTEQKIETLPEPVVPASLNTPNSSMSDDPIYKKAMGLIEKAVSLFQEQKKLDGFKKLIEAQIVLPGLDGLTELIESHRKPTMDALIAELEGQLVDVRDLNAREEIIDELEFAEILIFEWPETESIIAGYAPGPRMAAEAQLARLQEKKRECDRLRAKAEDQPVAKDTSQAQTVLTPESELEEDTPEPDSETPEDPELTRLRNKLTNTSSLEILKQGIGDARKIQISSGLPQTFVDMLADAQNRYASEIVALGIVFGNSVAEDFKRNHSALEELTRLQSGGKIDVYDSRMDSIRPIQEVLKETRDTLLKNTADYVHRSMDKINLNINRDPYAAENILEEAVYQDKEKKTYQPLGDENIAILQAKAAEITRAKEHFDRAKKLVQEADHLFSVDNLVGGFSKLIAAQSEFPGMELLTEKIDTYRQRASKVLIENMIKIPSDSGNLAASWPENEEVIVTYSAERRQQAEKVNSRIQMTLNQSKSSQAEPQPDRIKQENVHKPVEQKPVAELEDDTPEPESKILEDPELIRLRNKLTNTSSLEILKQGIEDARKIQNNRGLPQKFIDMLKSAETRYAFETVAQGEVTTNSVEDDFKKNHSALEELTRLQSEGKIDVYDTRTSSIRPIQDVLKETRERLLKNTAVYVQKAVDKIALNIYRDPYTASNILDDAIYQDKEMKTFQPLGDENIATLRAREADITRAKGNFEIARDLENEAKKRFDSNDLIGGFSKLIDAQAKFPGLEGLDDEIDRKRAQVLTNLIGKMDEHLISAKGLAVLDDHPDYDLAERELAECRNLAASWPENGVIREKYTEIRKKNAEQIAAPLDERIQECGQLQDSLTELRKDRANLDSLINEFHQYIQRNETIEQAKNALGKITSIDRFASLKEVSGLKDELEAREGIKTNLASAERSFDAGDWQSALKKCDEFLQNATGDQKQQAADLKQKSRAKLAIEEALAALNSNDIRLADQKFNEARSLVSEYILPYQLQLDRITAAKKNGESFKSWMTRAGQDAGKADVQNKVKALRIYLHIAGVQSIEGDSIAPFSESDVMLEARDRAEELKETLRKEFRDPLLKAYANRSKTPEPSDIPALSDTGRALRQQNLLDGMKELEAACWAEVNSAIRQEEAYIHNNRWDLAQRLWANLNQAYPETPEIMRHLTEATLQVTIQEFDRLMAKESPDIEAARNCLNSAELNLDLVGRVEIKHRWVTIYRHQEEYKKALFVLADISDETSVKLKQQLVVDQHVLETLESAQNALIQGMPLRALEYLKRGAEDDSGKKDDRLQKEFKKIWNDQVDDLKRRVFEDDARHTHDSEVAAVEKILEIRRYEKIRDEVSPEDWYSTKELTSRTESIIELSEKKYSLVRNHFEMVNGDRSISINDVINQIENLTDQMATIREAAGIVYKKVDKLQQKRIEGNNDSILGMLRQNGEFIEKLKLIKDKLGDVESGKYWMRAVTGSPADLDMVKGIIDRSAISCTREIREFHDRYEGYKWAMDKINRLNREISTAGLNEDFETVMKKIADARVILPGENPPSWLSTPEALDRYIEMLHWAANQFVIFRHVMDEINFENTVKGIDQIEKFSRDALANIQTWKELEKSLTLDQQMIEDIDRFARFFSLTISSPTDSVNLDLPVNPWNLKVITSANDAANYCKDPGVLLPPFIKNNVIAIVGISGTVINNLPKWYRVTFSTREEKPVKSVYSTSASIYPPLNLRKWCWEELQIRTDSWLKTFEEKIPGLACLCDSSLKIQINLDKAKQAVEKRKTEAETQTGAIEKEIDGMRGFPASNDFIKVLGNRPMLHSILEWAIKIGPENEAQAGLLEKGISNYSAPVQPDKPVNIIKKLFGN